MQFENLNAFFTKWRIDYLRAMKILMVCLGNICRSPLAEGILKDKADKAGLDWEIDSAGTLGRNAGVAPHPFSQKVALANGIDICSQKCRPFTSYDMEVFDRIYVMDEENYEDVKSLSGSKWNPKKVDFLLNAVYKGQNKSVPDPWYGGEEGFQSVYKMIDEACENIITSFATAKTQQ